MQRVERFNVTRGPALMTALRRALIVLATGATAAGLFLLTRGPADGPAPT